MEKRSNDHDNGEQSGILLESLNHLGNPKVADTKLTETLAHSFNSIEVQDVYQCTSLQEGLMALSLKQPGKFMPQITCRMPSNLDVERFKAAWQETVDSNTPLRTTIFQTSTSGMLQIVLARSEIDWQSSDCLHDYLKSDLKNVVSFGSVLFRYAIVVDSRSNQKHFVWTFHYALVDGWSMRLLLNQVNQRYQGANVHPLVPYSHFIAYIARLDRQKVDGFWRRQLSGTATDHFPAPPFTTYSPVPNCSLKHDVRIPNGLKTLATTSTVIQAAWALLLRSYTSSNDVVSGMVLAGRDGPVENIANVNGPTFTTVPMRICINPEESVTAYLTSIRKMKSGVKPYQHAGLQNIRKLDADCAAACNFRHLLVIQPMIEKDLNSLFWDRDRLSDTLTRLNIYDLMLECAMTSDGFTALANFDTTTITEGQMKQMLAELESVIFQFDSNKETLVGDIKAHVEGGSHHLQAYVADFQTVDLSFPELLQQHASEREDFVAICSWDGELSYAELDSLSLQLARRLGTSSVGPESMVPLLFEKSLWAIVAIMAVMRAGGTFVPLDPSHPKDRLKSIIQETGARLLLCSEKCANIFPDTFSEVIVVRPSLPDLPSTHLTLQRVRPDNGLYVFFTSGSTGKPKGCVVEHSACCSSMVQLVKSFGMDHDSRVLQFSSFGFDGCILEILGTLLAGGCICVPSEEIRLTGITGFMYDKRVNFAFFTPSFSRMLSPDDVPTLKTLVIGGEKITREDIGTWYGKLRLFQAYGPTECCVMCVTTEVIDKSSMPNEMGRGIIGNFVVLNEAGKITSAGFAGELCIGGPNLARGYLNDSEKTAAAFRCDLPQALGLDHITRRLYKTGDLVKMRSDGTIEFLGRKDKQVKLRGQRVELGDVEHHLRQSLANVEDLAVELIVPANDVQNPRLAAFLCLDRRQMRGQASVEKNSIAMDPLPPEISARIWDHLSRSLPRHMVPTLLIPLQAIPLSVSGKIDRRKLQSAAESLTKEELIAYSTNKRERSVPVTENEQKLCLLWAQILNVPAKMIGQKANFIQLGGDSILAMKLVVTAREQGLVLSVADVFQSPDLRDLAMMATVAESLQDTVDMKVPPFSLLGGADRARSLFPEVSSQCDIEVDKIEDLYPCTPFQEGIMVLSIRQPGAYVVQNSFELSTDQSLDLETFCLAWDTVVKSNPILRSRIIQSDRAGLMQVVVKEPIQWLFHDDLDDYFQKSKELSMGFGTRLTRYAIVSTTRGRSDKYLFVWCAHHAIYDGWSIGLILKQVDRKYHSLKSNNTREALRDSTQLPLDFNIFVRALQGVDMRESDAFWHEQFIEGEAKTFPPSQSKVLSSPTAVLKSTVQYIRKGKPNVTIATIVRAAWAVTISSYAKSNDVVFGATLSGRTGSIAGVERIVGPTATTVPVRIIVNPSISVADFLQSVQKQAMDMTPFEHRGLTNIGRLNSKTMVACRLGNLLVIQLQPATDVGRNTMHFQHHETVHVGIFDTYPLTMECVLDEKSVTVKAIYDPGIIDESLMKSVNFQFQHILRQLCMCGDQDLMQDVRTINPEDHDTLWRWNAKLPETVASCIHSLIEQKTLEDQDAQAVCAWDGALSYRDLDMQSSRVAHNLMNTGVGPEVTVPLLFDKSKWFVVAILGVLKAGGVFAPLEPSHPPARLASINDKLKPSVLICSPRHSDLCHTTFPDCTTFILDDYRFAELVKIDATSHVTISPGNAAYVVFTSGTTGVPKGIIIEHGQYCSSAKEHSKALHFDRNSRHLQFASHSFDICIEDILTTLLTGGCICIPSEDEKKNDIVGVISRFNVTKADLTPSFLNHIEPWEVPSLEVLILGGEPLTTKTIKAWASHVRLVNGYGTSECSVTNTVNADIHLDTDPANIGRAVGGVCWIVDPGDHDKLVPIGAVGELVIEGPVLARGYLNDESRTSAAFINTPAWAREENGIHRPSRIYKTGDLAQYNPDGTICYRGRKDSQVKIRGQRVELHEVEKHLIDYPDVECAMALVPDSGPCAKNLTAVIQARSLLTRLNDKDIELVTDDRLKKSGFHWSDLAAFLHDRVPVYMIPTKWVALERIPLHITKKLDRSRVASWLSCLSNEQQHIGRPTDGSTSPLGDDEIVAMDLSHKIARLVSDGSVVGQNASISSIGMDSIRLASLAAFVTRQFAVSLPMQTFISSGTTIRDISKQIAEAKTGVEFQAFPQTDLMAEISKLESQLYSAQRPQHRLHKVFLTGATGFLGTQILQQLLCRVDVEKVIVLVRAESLDLARRRIITSAKAARWSVEAFSSKLEVWTGDLALPRLGLTFQQWESLGRIDAIIHNGAAMQWNAGYDALKPSNVTSTMELLSVLSASRYSHRSPRFVYVSGGRDFGDDVSDVEAARMLASVEGYSQTKFVSELLVKNFRKKFEHRPLDICIVKPALIIGTAKEGVANEKDFLWRLVAGAVNVGGFPTQRDGEDWLMVSSVDRVAAAVIQCLSESGERASCGHTIRIVDGVTLSEFWTMVEDTLSTELIPMDYAGWMHRVQEDVDAKKESHPLWPVMHMLNKSNLASKRPKQDEVSKEAMDSIRAAIPTNVQYLVDRKFLQKPARSPARPPAKF